MSSMFRYLCLAAGAVLIIAGWFVINSERIQQATIENMGRVVASRMLAESTDGPAGTRTCALAAPSAADPGDSSWSFLGPQMGSWMRALLTATTSYIFGVVIIILGAALIGLAVPAGSFGGGKIPRGSGVNWACLLMLAQACLFLCCGFAAFYAADFRGGHMFLGTRSAAILVLCAALTSFIRHSRAVGLVGYYSGLILTPVLGLNFLRLALKQPITLDALNFAIVAKALMGLSSFVAIIILWRALPGGLDRARLSLQVRRFAAGAGAAVLLAGFCVTKASLLPQQALAEGNAAVLLDDPQIKTTLEELGVPQELIDAGREKLAEMGTDLDDLEGLQAAAAEVLSEWEEDHPDALAEGRGEELLQVARQVTGTAPTATGGDVPSDARNISDLLNELSTSQMQQLLREAGVNADLTKPGAMERARQEAGNVDVNDPRVREALNKLGLDRPTSSGETAPPSTAVSQVSQQDAQTVSSRIDGAAAVGTGNAQSVTGSGRLAQPPNANQPRTIRPLPSRIDNRIADPRLSGTRVPPGEWATYRTPRPSSPPPSVPPRVKPATDVEHHAVEVPQSGSADPAREPARDVMTEAAWFNTTEFDETPDFNTIESDAWLEPLAIAPDESAGTPFAPPIEDDENAGGQQIEAQTEGRSAMPAVTSPPPAPPPPAGPDTLSRLEMMIHRTTNRASGYGLLAMLTGSMVFLAAVLLRRTGWQQSPAQTNASQ